MKKILLLSDTHGYLDDKIIKYVNESDEVWHAGDIGKKEILNSLSETKPLKAVYGNIDGREIRLQTKEFLFFNYGNHKVLITHIAGYPGKYNKSVKTLISSYEPNILVCGHSHILKVIYDKKNKHLHLNPGAAGISGFHKTRTMLRFQLNYDKVNKLEVIEICKR